MQCRIRRIGVTAKYTAALSKYGEGSPSRRRGRAATLSPSGLFFAHSAAKVIRQAFQVLTEAYPALAKYAGIRGLRWLRRERRCAAKYLAPFASEQPASEADLPGTPALTALRNVGAGLLKGEHRFFEPQPLAPQEPPKRIVRELHAVRRKLTFSRCSDKCG